MFFTSLKHNYSNLFNFSGRDTRAQFWPFALTHIAIAIAIWIPIFVAELLDSLARMRAFARENPDKVTVVDEPGRYSITVHESVPGLGPDIDMLILPLFGLSILLIVLFAAAVTRRLHDTGRRGWIGSIPAALLIIAFLVMREIFTDREDGFDSALFFTGFGLNLAYNVSLIVLIILLCMGSQPESNKFGPTDLAR